VAGGDTFELEEKSIAQFITRVLGEDKGGKGVPSCAIESGEKPLNVREGYRAQEGDNIANSKEGRQVQSGRKT